VNARIYDSSGTPFAGGGTDADGNDRISDLMWLLPGTYFVVAEDYARYGAQLYDGIPCTSGCDVTLGVPVTVFSGETTTGIDFTMSSSIFADGFESGDASVWSHTVGGL